jgi:hypothetical protein
MKLLLLKAFDDFQKIDLPSLTQEGYSEFLIGLIRLKWLQRLFYKDFAVPVGRRNRCNNLNAHRNRTGKEKSV